MPRSQSLAVLALLLAAPAAAQSIVRGVVTTAGGQPIAGAIATRSSAPSRVFTDSSGRFVLGDLSIGVHTITVRQVGFLPSEVTFELLDDTTLDIDFHLAASAITLDTITVRDTVLGIYGDKLRYVGFVGRRQQGIVAATFLTPADIDRRRPQHMSSLLDGVPGVHLQYTATRAGQVMVARGRDSRCPMTIVVDGQVFWDARPDRRTDQNMNDILVTDVAAVEVYPSPASAPHEFHSLSGRCGVIVIWTKQ